MQSIREETEKLEEILVGENGVRAANTIGRVIVEDEDSVRTAFQRDVDRITHSKAFRRLKQKTQVFLDPEGDHYRTRLTHTLEVTRIARTMARALRFNEDLTEAISLGHDLGHTPFGHAGERALNVIMEADGGFRHYEQSLRVVDTLEKNGRGLNLTYEVRDGIVRHTCDPLAATFEGQAVRLADKIAYINHDVDDAIRAGVLSSDDIPRPVVEVLGRRYSERINTIVTDVIGEGCASGRLRMSPEVGAAVDTFHEFLYENVYRNPTVKGEERKVQGLINGIFEYYFKNPEKMSEEYLAIADRDGLTRAVCDYVAGMTDSYAISVHKDIFIPMAWTVK
ncbi:MAG: deoxyguanosinetriphosphate triphosphohydrolase [Oscillospiraceae bacterium]|nr:deoxyguanosinetriphosphate triphosphohydrolase [Oscillospiraceae bacterium]